jgi:hypothetical protein
MRLFKQHSGPCGSLQSNYPSMTDGGRVPLQEVQRTWTSLRTEASPFALMSQR